MVTGFEVLGAISASWSFTKDIFAFCKRHHDGKTAIPSALMRIDNDSLLLGAIRNSLSEEVLATFDQESVDHLHRILSYLEPILRSTKTKLYKYESKGFWDKTKWAAVGGDLKDAEKALYEWVDRLQKCMVLLPGPAKGNVLTALRTTLQGSSSWLGGVVAQQQMEEKIMYFQQLTQKENEELIRHLRVRLTGQAIEETHVPWTGGKLVELNGEYHMIEWKRLPASRAGDVQARSDAKNELVKLISVLSVIEPEKMFCMRGAKYFESETEQTVPFGVIYKLPARFKPPVQLSGILATVDDRGARVLKHSLDQRFELIRQIASALLFVHSVGWVHKGIEPSNIWLANRQTSTAEYPDSLGTAFLAGFDYTRREIAVSTGDETAGSNWRRKIYQHPDRELLQGQEEPSTLFDPVHDIYALGVVMIEIGRWKPLHAYADLFRNVSAVQRRENLEKMADALRVTLGNRYVGIALRCLAAADVELPAARGRTAMRDIVLDLEDLAIAMA